MEYTSSWRPASYATLRDKIGGAGAGATLRHSVVRKRPDETIWALKDVAFEIMPGEVVGVMVQWRGKVNAAESASRITEPTAAGIEL